MPYLFLYIYVGIKDGEGGSIKAAASFEPRIFLSVRSKQVMYLLQSSSSHRHGC